ncbi:hypothetical protein MHYP_G00095900 [Metynnis hypsauchen]
MQSCRQLYGNLWGKHIRVYPAFRLMTAGIGSSAPPRHRRRSDLKDEYIYVCVCVCICSFLFVIVTIHFII